MDAAEQPLRVAIVYYSRFGALGDLATHIGAGVAEIPGTRPEFINVEDQPLEEVRPGSADETQKEREDEMRQHRAALLAQLTTADALIVGAPAYFGSMASPVKRFFEDVVTASTTILDRTRPWHQPLFRDKAGAAFTASATPHGGNEQALHSILTMLMHLGLIVVTPGQRGPILEHGAAPYGATAITGPTGDRQLMPEEEEEAHHLGRRVAEVAMWLRDGRLVGVDQQRERARSAAQGHDPSA